VRQIWPEGLTIAKEADGSARLTGIAQGTAGILPEILRWCRHAAVLGGEELQTAYRNEVVAIARNYI
jgi:hypothetical protein